MFDPRGMYDAIKQFPVQWQEGRRLALEADLAALSLNGIENVVIAGMGGSAIGGDLLRTLALSTASLPVLVSRSYEIPAFVGPRTLFIASSYSGNTEETLCALDAALAADAQVACITSGGRVLHLAQTHQLPFIEVPGGMQPRAALGYSLTALLTIAESAGMLLLGDRAWVEAQQMLEQQSSILADPSGNPAKALAAKLNGLMPFIYSGSGLLEAVNLRWQTQIHENSKTLAKGNFFPELNHNEIMGWEGKNDMYKQIGIVVLKDQDDHSQVHRRIDISRELLASRAGCWEEVESSGAHALTRILSLVYLGDWVSFYLAAHYEIDPTPVGLISQLKEKLAQPV